MRNRQGITAAAAARRVARLGKRGLAVTVLTVLLVGTTAPSALAAQKPAHHPAHHVVVRPMDGQGDSPIMP
jgi:hypothetical protein